MSQLRVAHLSHAYDAEPVLNDISLALAPGELLCLLGPSGCGKTTLLRLVAGLEPVRQGRIEIDGQAIADAETGLDIPPERRRVGLMFQDYALFPHLTVRQNVVFGLKDRASTDRLLWVEDVLARVGLAGYAGRYPHTLSGGQQQRVALLRALAPEPRVMLLDEPFSGLDLTLRTQVRSETLDIHTESGVATLMVTHDPDEAMFMADTVAIIESGRVVQQGPPSAIYMRPATPFVAGLFGPLNRLTGRVQGGRVSTPLGVFEAAHLAEGAAVQVLIRHEALRLADAPLTDGAMCLAPRPARLLAARLIGRATHLRLQATEGGIELQARIPGTVDAVPGRDVMLAVDRARAFVFAE